MNSSPERYTAAAMTEAAVYKFHIIFIFFTVILHFSLFPQSAFSDSIDLIRSSLEKSEYNKQGIGEVMDLCIDADLRGIPLEFIKPRIDEALSKKVSSSKLAEVLVNEIGTLDKARSVIEKISDADSFLRQKNLWQRTAVLFSAGADEDTAAELVKMNIQNPDRYIPSTSLFVSLVKWGLPDMTALSLVKAVLDSSLKEDDYSGIISLFIRSRRSNIPPEKFAARITGELGSVRTFRQLEKRVLQ